MVDHDENEQSSERMLPVAIVGRIMKQVLPGNAKISKEAKETIQESATEFISFVTAEASDKCHKENRKTLNGDDICWALSSLGFDNYADAIIRYLHKYRQAERERVHNQIKLTSPSSNSPSAISAAAKLDKDSNFPQISNTQMPNLDADFHQISTTQKPNLHKDADFQQISTTQKPNLDKDANFHQISTAHEKPNLQKDANFHQISTTQKPNLHKDASFLQISATHKPFIDKDANFHQTSTTQNPNLVKDASFHQFSATQKPNLDKDATFHQILTTQKQKTTPSQLEFRVLEKGNSSSFINDS